jgi:hypothetical protein
MAIVVRTFPGIQVIPLLSSILQLHIIGAPQVTCTHIFWKRFSGVEGFCSMFFSPYTSPLKVPAVNYFSASVAPIDTIVLQ